VHSSRRVDLRPAIMSGDVLFLIEVWTGSGDGNRSLNLNLIRSRDKYYGVKIDQMHHGPGDG